MIVNTKVAVESQPAAFRPTNVVSYVPLVVYVFPFHVYDVQFEIGVDDDVFCLMVKTNVAVESHPDALVNILVFVPLVV